MMEKNNLVRSAELIAAIPAVAGAVFKLMHWPGADILLIIGLCSLALLQLLKAQLPESGSRKKVMQHYARHVSLAVLLIGILFYLMHWSSGKLLLQIGIAFFAIAVVWELFGGNAEE